jgi:hypothetical protein
VCVCVRARAYVYRWTKRETSRLSSTARALSSCRYPAEQVSCVCVRVCLCVSRVMYICILMPLPGGASWYVCNHIFRLSLSCSLSLALALALSHTLTHTHTQAGGCTTTSSASTTANLRWARSNSCSRHAPAKTGARAHAYKKTRMHTHTHAHAQ